MSNKEKFIELVRVALPFRCAREDTYNPVSAVIAGMAFALEVNGHAMGRWSANQLCKETEIFVEWVANWRMEEKHKPEWVK